MCICKRVRGFSRLSCLGVISWCLTVLAVFFLSRRLDWTRVRVQARQWHMTFVVLCVASGSWVVGLGQRSFKLWAFLCVCKGEEVGCIWVKERWSELCLLLVLRMYELVSYKMGPRLHDGCLTVQESSGVFRSLQQTVLGSVQRGQPAQVCTPWTMSVHAHGPRQGPAAPRAPRARLGAAVKVRPSPSSSSFPSQRLLALEIQTVVPAP